MADEESAAGLDCAACGSAMGWIRRGPVRALRCPSCGAHALTAATLRRLVPDGFWPEVWPAIRRAARAGSRACPGCARPMEVSPPLAAAGGFRVDVCDPCQLIWLDPSEFERIPKRAFPPEAVLPPELAREMAMAEVELMNLEYDAREGQVFALVDRLIGFLMGALFTFRRGRSP